MARLGVALLLALAGCKTVAHGDVYEAVIEDAMLQAGSPATLDCPDRIPLGKVPDNHFRCTYTFPDGRAGRIDVQVTSVGGLKWDVAP